MRVKCKQPMLFSFQEKLKSLHLFKKDEGFLVKILSCFNRYF